MGSREVEKSRSRAVDRSSRVSRFRGAIGRRFAEGGGGGKSIRRSTPRSIPRLFGETVHAALAEGDRAEGDHAEGAADAERRCRGNRLGGELSLRRQAVDLRLVDQEKERVQPAEDLVVRAVEVGVLRLSRVSRLGVELLHALVGDPVQLLDRAELDRLGRAGLGAGGLSPACSRS